MTGPVFTVLLGNSLSDVFYFAPECFSLSYFVSESPYCKSVSG